MRRITKLIIGSTFAAGIVASGTAAMAMDDRDDSSTTYYYQAPSPRTAPPSTMFYQRPRPNYSPTDIYNTPNGVYGYYENRYNPYWHDQGPRGQGSGHDTRIGR